MAETAETAERQQREEAQAEGCPEVMSVGGRCGRPLYNAPAGVDKVPVCLMHSRDPNKDNVAFQQEFERILEEAGEGIAEFTCFVFPAAEYAERNFRCKCIFPSVTFTDSVNFSGATFAQGANFFEATFTQRANFFKATFTQGAGFLGAIFTERASFFEATFTQWASFRQSQFAQQADFSGAKFTQQADFYDTSFNQGANFLSATFDHWADFKGATFEQWANFTETTFQRVVHFSHTKFPGYASFRFATFRWEVQFRETEFCRGGDEVGAAFGEARFEKPEAVIFYKTDLQQVLFHNCDVSSVVFSNVEWRRRKNGKRMLFEEIVGLEDGAAGALRPPEGSADERNYALIAELYQQLKKNFDDRRDYGTAGDFHYGEMEMKRQSSRRRNRVLRWLHRNLGLTAWYKYASEYGESYRRPLALLIAVLLLFTLAYPLVGLERAARESGTVVSWARIGQFLAERNYAWWSVAAFWLHGLLMAASVMVLQRELPYSPVSSLGWWLRLAEYLLSVILIPLFLLAVRRQFRR